MHKLLLALVVASCSAAAPQGAAATMAPLLGCWRGAFQGNAEIIDERCFAVLNAEHVVDVHAVRPTTYSGETTYHLDDSNGRIIFAYAASDGGRSHGVLERTAEGFRFPEHEYRAPDGAVRRLRSVWTFDGPDRFVVVSEHDQGEGWRPLAHITYSRARDLQ